MIVSRKDFIRWSEDLTREFHTWEFWMPFNGNDGQGHTGLQMRVEKFTPEEYETPDDQYEALCSMVRGARDAEMDYYVFCDDKLVLNF